MMSTLNMLISRSKRELDEDIQRHTERKRIRKFTVGSNDRGVTCIEVLPNEIFYELFDYLDGWDIFKAFFNLNMRFNNLLNLSTFPLKLSHAISSASTLDNQYEQLIIAHRHRLLSFSISTGSYLPNPSPLLTTIRSFDRLECLSINEILYQTLLELLSNLMTLPRLFALKIYFGDRLTDLSNLYTWILSLPVLKYLKLFVMSLRLPISSPVNTERSSSLEHLVLDYSCNILHLLTILPHTPYLTHLVCSQLLANKSIPMNMPVNLGNLKYLRLAQCDLDFDFLEILVQKYFSQLRILHLRISMNETYLDADRWKQLILQDIPHLRNQSIRFIILVPTKMVLEIKLSPHSLSDMSTVFSIQPFKKQWYELADNTIDDLNLDQMTISSTWTEQTCTDVSSSRLRVTIPMRRLDEIRSQFDKFTLLFADSKQFTDLYLDFEQFSISIVLHFLRLLPNLHSLTITSEYAERMKLFCEQQASAFHSASTQNNITKLSIEQMAELDQVHLFMNLCPRMRYLQLKCRNITDAEWLIRYVLIKQNADFIPHLHFVCLWLLQADEIITNHLQRIIDREKLVPHYRLMRICDRIYLRWNTQF